MHRVATAAELRSLCKTPYRFCNAMTDSVVESYHVSALSVAAELLWFHNIVVVVSAGNSGTAALAASANDPFVITVGATDDRGTPAITDDTVPTWSASGRTIDGFNKPDLVAPGTNIVSLLSSDNSLLAAAYPPESLYAGNWCPSLSYVGNLNVRPSCERCCRTAASVHPGSSQAAVADDLTAIWGSHSHGCWVSEHPSYGR